MAYRACLQAISPDHYSGVSPWTHSRHAWQTARCGDETTQDLIQQLLHNLVDWTRQFRKSPLSRRKKTPRQNPRHLYPGRDRPLPLERLGDRLDTTGIFQG